MQPQGRIQSDSRHSQFNLQASHTAPYGIPTVGPRRVEQGISKDSGIRLRPVSDLREYNGYCEGCRTFQILSICGLFTADMYRALFKFGVFNAVQSECFDEVMHGDDNMVCTTFT